MLAGQLALLTSAVFTGAAVYINLVEQPARLGLDDQALLTEWKPAYKRGTAMQGSLAIVAFLLAVAAWRQTGQIGWIAGGVLMLANWPFTLVAIMPTNRKLMATELAGAGPQSRSLIARWELLHRVRTTLGIAAAVTFLWTSLM